MNREEQLIIVVRDLYNKMAWLNGLKMKDRFKGYKSSEIHCIEFIGKNTGSNVTKLAESFYMTRGAMTKMTRKLIGKGVIESYQKPDNKKEIYFRLTKQGKAIYKIHDELHGEFRKRDRTIFRHMTEKQFDSLIGFAEKYSRHLDAEIKKLGTDTKLP